MPAPLSVIVPTLDAEPALQEMLPAVFAGVAAGLVREVIVSDGGSGDRTCDLAEATGARLVTGPAGRGGQLRRGCAEARGDWLLVLHADTRLPEGWVPVVETAMAEPGRAHAFRLSFRAQGVAPPLVAGWANLRSRVIGLPYGDQGLLISQDLYRAAGGYPDIPLMEDVAIARALKGRIRLMPARVTTSAERYQEEGWLRRGWHNLRTLARYLGGVPPERLVRDYAAGASSSSSSAPRSLN